MASKSGVYVVGLKEFQSALRAAQARGPTALTAALKVAGEPLVKEASARSPHISGALQGGYRTQVRGTTGNIVNRVPYAAGAEWGTHRKWSGFQKYGARGDRFAGRAIDEKAGETLLTIYEAMEQIATAYGWAT